MVHRFISITVFLLLCAAGRSQSVTPDVIASAGDYFSNSSGSISWTLGEIMGETYSSSGNWLTQGFQQPTDFGTRVGSSIDTVNANVYPNPTTGSVNLLFGNDCSGIYVVEVYNALGEVLSTRAVSATPGFTTTISLFDYADGLYFITIRTMNGVESSSFRIIKNS